MEKENKESCRPNNSTNRCSVQMGYEGSTLRHHRQYSLCRQRSKITDFRTDLER